MGRMSYTEEVASEVAPSRMFQAGVLDMMDVGPKAMPGKLLGISIVEGDGGIGSIFQVNYTDDVLWGVIRERVEKVDPERFECKYTILEGGPVGKKLESIVRTMRLLPRPEGGCVYRSTMEVDTIPGVDFTEQDLEALKVQDFSEFRALESYLLANPSAYAHSVNRGYTEEIATKVAPARLFQAGAVDAHNLAPKILPEVVKSVDILEGDGDVGSIKQINYTKAFPWEYVKESIDVLDREKFVIQYTLFEGGPFGTKLKSAVYVMKLVPLAFGGCVFRITAVFNAIPGVEFTEEDMQTIKAMDIGQFRALEGYLLANPAAYA